MENMKREIIHRFMMMMSLALLLFASCTTNKYTRLMQEDKRLPQYEKEARQHYRLQVDDELEVRILSLNKEALAVFNTGKKIYRIYTDGTIDMPFMDSIRIVNLTLDEAADTLRRRLRSFIVDAEVSISLSNNYFYMFGDGGNTVSKVYKDKITIYEAIAMAGGINKVGSRKHVYLLRKDAEGVTQTQIFDIRPRSIIESKYYYIQPNDIIYIPPSSERFFRMDSFSAVLSVVSTSMALFFLIYGLTKK